MSKDTEMEVDFDENGLEKQHRRAFRVEAPTAVTITIGTGEKQYIVKDISFLGVAFISNSLENFQIGQKLKIDVLLKEYVFLQSISAEVVRIIAKESCIACSFPEITATDELRLTKLVLEIQKEHIRRKRYT